MKFVFPAYAGVILVAIVAMGKPLCFPRIRGGDPGENKSQIAKRMFSPHTRG